MGYKCLTKKSAKVGDKVILVNPSSHYMINIANPVICSHFECCGVISGVDGSIISVKWDNGTRNGYIDNELVLSKHRKTIQKDIQSIKQGKLDSKQGKWWDNRQGKWNDKFIPTEAENGRYVSIW